MEIDYKEKFEKAYEIIKQMHDGGIVAKVDIENAFPELKEKSIIEMLKIAVSLTSWLDCDKNNCLAWIDHQDPQKHEEEIKKAFETADKVQYRRGYEDAMKKIKRRWSDKDENRFENLCRIIYESEREDAAKEACVEWLNEIKCVNQWRPNEQQLVELYRAIHDWRLDWEQREALVSLFGELKNLEQ